MINLNLIRPLVVFDLETTGVNVTSDRIVEIALIKLMPDGTELEYCKRVNPTVPIPAESSAIHGIYDKDVADCPVFADIADEVAEFIGDADLGGYNSNKFDVPVLAEELLRCNHPFAVQDRKMVDVQNIFHKMEQRTLAAAYQFYCQETMENAHNALYDTRVTVEVFKSQLNRYQDLAKNIDELAVFTRYGDAEIHDFAGRLARNAKGQVMYNFGKHKGKTVEQVNETEPGYYGWMLDADFPLYTKQMLRLEMERIRSTRPVTKKVEAPQREHTPRKEETPEDMAAKLAALQNKFGK